MASEQRAFVFSVSFILIFATLLSTIPIDFQGADTSPDIVIPVDPSLVTGFSETENWTKSAVDGFGNYAYTLGGNSWVFFSYSGLYYQLGSKVLIGGVLWLGQLDSCKFISEEGLDRGAALDIVEIDEDDTDGVVRYNLLSIGSGNSKGGFVIYWNTTAYSDPLDAYNADALYFLHGLGLGESATANIGGLIVSLLFFQIPEVPLLINMIIVIPIWASIVYVLWFVIKEMIPFV